MVRFIVIYKDNGETHNRYFGPFASGPLAKQFMDALPSPTLGGLKTYKMLQPYTSEEAAAASNSISRKRELEATMCDIAANVDWKNSKLLPFLTKNLSSGAT